MRKIIKLLGAAITIILLLSIFSATAYRIEKVNNSNSTYNGHLRIYIVEPKSRWDNKDGDPYHYGFLDFAYNDKLSIEYQDTFTEIITWDGGQAGFSNIKENNIMVIAAVFNPEINKGYADPPMGNKFDAHYVDAAAGAKPGETGSNIVNEDFTHTVFVEEATVQYCPYCPAMAEALNDVYISGDYPFYFVALITKDYQRNVLNSIALDYLRSVYNLAAYPSAFFDGGKKVLVGGYDDESYYRTRIEQCGNRDVHDLDFNLAVEWVEDGVIEIEISITNNEETINNAPNTPEITGPTTGKINQEQEYMIVTTDPEGDDVYYWVEFCADCQDAEWSGSYKSGEEFVIGHTWSSSGDYTVRAKAKDSQGLESDWGSLEVSMPKNKAVNTPLFLQFLQQHPHMFQLLQQLLELQE